MFRRLFPLVVVLTCFPGGFFKQSPKESTVLSGQVAILPCNFSEDDDPQFVEWSKENLRPNAVLLYREGKEEHGMKDKAFRYRTSLVRPEMDNSNKSLRIADVQLSDEGNYTCRSRKSNNKLRDVTTVWLSVVTVSSPELTLVQSMIGATVQCGVRCSPCELEVEFLNEEGNVLPSEERKFPSDDRGFFNVTRRMLVPDITRVTCRVTQKKINQTWSRTLSVPDYCKVSCASFNNTAIILGVVVAILIITIIIIITMKCWKSRDDPHSSKASLQSSTPVVNSPAEKVPLIDDMDGSKIKHPTQTADATYRQQEDKPSHLSPAGSHQPPQASAASSSTASTGNATVQEARFLQAPKQKPKGDVQPSKSGNRKHPGKIRLSHSNCSAASSPNIPKFPSHYHTMPLLSGNRYAALSDINF